eukprot:scaffold40797_cov63-Attheya_sp.AAC.1
MRPRRVVPAPDEKNRALLFTFKTVRTETGGSSANLMKIRWQMRRCSQVNILVLDSSDESLPKTSPFSKAGARSNAPQQSHNMPPSDDGDLTIPALPKAPPPADKDVLFPDVVMPTVALKPSKPRKIPQNKPLQKKTKPATKQIYDEST